MHRPRISSSIGKYVFILFTVLIAIFGIICFLGKSQFSQQPDFEQSITNQVNTPSQRLLVSVVKNEEISEFSIFSPEFSDIGGNVSGRKLEQVNICLNGITKPLEEAMQDGYVSFHEIAAWAALDADNGFCKESTETKRGLTMCRYIYREFMLTVINDVYQTPDGQDHLIQECIFYPSGVESISIRSMVFTDKTGAPLDREDWGLSLELIEVSPSDITFQVHQSGGQHIGNLVTDMLSLYCITTEAEVYRTTKEFSIENSGTTVISLNWEDECGKLPGGTYSLVLGISDIFTEEQRHPLMLDYNVWQAYGLEFTIP